MFIADDDDERPHLIHIAAGRYDNLQENFPLPMINETTIRGAGVDETIIDAFGSYSNAIFANFTNDWAVENLTITGGLAIEGGGLSAYQGSRGTLRNLTFRGNRADLPLFPNSQGRGGAMMIYEVEEMLLENILFINNSAYDDGGAIVVVRCSPLIDHVTIVQNEADQGNNSHAVLFEGNPGQSITIQNSIIWGNPSLNNPGVSLAFFPVAEIEVRYSLVENDDDEPWEGIGNILADPLFTIPGEDFTVLPGSPAVDSGDPESPFDQEPQPNGARTNVGVYGNTPRAQFSGALYPLPRNVWRFFGLPVDPETSDPGELFGDDFNNLTPGDNTWRLQRWNSQSAQFFRYGEPEEGGVEIGEPPAVEPGLGYFIHQSLENRVNLHVGGHVLDQTETAEIPLDTGVGATYQMVANPFPYPINWTDTHLQTPTGLLTFDEAADQGYANRYAYLSAATGDLLPTLKSIDPWQGVVIVTYGDEDLSWQVFPQRNVPAQGNLRQNLEWGLVVSATALDEFGDGIRTENGRLFGVGEDMTDGEDPYDGLTIDWFPGFLTFRWTSETYNPLICDVRSPIGEGESKGWHAEIIARLMPNEYQQILPDSVEISIQGFRNLIDDGEWYPEENYNFWLTNEYYTVLYNNLRDSTTFRLPMEHVSESERRLGVWFFAGNNVTPAPATLIEHLRGNYFELISTYVVPENLNAVSVFGGIHDLAIAYQNNGRVFIPPELNTIGDITLTQGYQLFCYAPSQLVIAGELVDPTMEYTLLANRWNWLGYPFDSEMPVEWLLEPVAEQLFIVMNDNGRFWIPQLLNNLGVMQPGSGYFTFVRETLTFQYNQPVMNINSGNFTALGSGLWALGSGRTAFGAMDDTPTPTGLPYLVLVSMTDALLARNPAIIELYDGSLLVGRAVVEETPDPNMSNCRITPVIAWGGLAEKGVTGFVSGHTIDLRIIRADGVELPMVIEKAELIGSMRNSDSDRNQYLAFGEGAYAEVTLTTTDVSLPNEFAIQPAYPNPFNSTVTIPFALPENGDVTFTVFNILGQVVYQTSRIYQTGYYSFVFNAEQSDRSLVSGMYFLEVQYNHRSERCKIIFLK